MQNNTKFRTYKDSPGRKYFSPLIADDGLIDAIDASIDFNQEVDESGVKIKEVAVTFFPDRLMRELKYKDHPLREEQRAAYMECSHSGVASLFDEDDGWMRDGNIMPPPELADETGSCLGYSPIGDFAWLSWFGFENIEYAKQALEQFGFIRECTWARDGSIDPASLVKSGAIRKSQAEIHKIKSWIYSEETKRCRREFESEVKRQMASGEMKKCPKNVDMYFESMLLKPETAETNPQYLELKEQWDALREKMINERDARIKKRDCHAEKEIRAYHASQIEDEIKYYEYKQKEKIFDDTLNQKISSREWVVPEGVSVFGKGLMISGGAAHWDKNAPVNVLSRQLDELKTQIFGE